MYVVMFQNLSDKLGDWFEVKLALSLREEPPLFKEREIWWGSVGLNIGFEVFGKKELFARPILVIRKYNKYTFLGLPLTSRRKDIPAHYHFDFNNRQGSVLLDQAKTFDARRLSERIGRIPS
jgi:mRNA-degrading endonuclease toxin of MazEF toxin-antitoxin module